MKLELLASRSCSACKIAQKFLEKLKQEYDIDYEVHYVEECESEKCQELLREAIRRGEREGITVPQLYLNDTGRRKHIITGVHKKYEDFEREVLEKIL